MLRHTASVLAEHGFAPASASVVIIGNRPKIGPRRVQAEQALSAAVGCPVSVTATTTDGMGFTGAGQGVAAIANALVTETGTAPDRGRINGACAAPPHLVPRPRTPWTTPQ